MKSYCLKCREDTENINPKVLSTSSGKAMIFSKSVTCGSKNQDLLKIKEQKNYLAIWVLEHH